MHKVEENQSLLLFFFFLGVKICQKATQLCENGILSSKFPFFFSFKVCFKMIENCFFFLGRVSPHLFLPSYNFKSSLSRKWPRDAHHPGSIRKLFWKKNTLIVIQLNNKWKHLDTFLNYSWKKGDLPSVKSLQFSHNYKTSEA
jgi:hypothetical protein